MFVFVFILSFLKSLLAYYENIYIIKKIILINFYFI